MQIDWFTFVAQIINFLILLALLRHFLYGPITRAMDAREAANTALVKDAESAWAAAEAEAQTLQAARADLAATRQSYLAQAADDAEARRKELVAQARDEVEEMMARWYDGVEQERAAFLAEVRARLTNVVWQIVRRTLSDLADAELEAKIVDRFHDRLVHLPDYQRHALIESGGDFSDDVIIASSFDLAYPQRQELIDAIQQMLVQESHVAVHGRPVYHDEVGVRFERNPELTCGIELLVQERRVAWSMRDYVDALSREIGQVLDGIPDHAGAIDGVDS